MNIEIEGVLPLIAIAIGLITAYISVKKHDPEKPSLFVSYYIHLIRNSRPGIHNYAKERTNYSKREHYLAAFFITFFLFWLVGLIVISILK